MPKDLGEVCASGCPGAVATVAIEVANDDFRPRSFVFAASGPAGSFVELVPEKVEIGPKEQHTLTARMTLPSTSQDGLRLDSILWVRGCHDHFVRWSVCVGTRSIGGCRRVCLADRPDYVHHWYDHFYCVNGCRGSRVVDR
jgi:hypothetical protein